MPAPNADAAYQGARGAFSEQAARALLGAHARLQPCRSFDEVFAALSAGLVPAAIVPLVNSLAGPVPGVAGLMRRHGTRIVTEHRLRIAHFVIGVPGATMAQVRCVWSHPMALAQCRRWFGERPQIAPRRSFDTAGAVAHVMARGDREEAAIAGPQAASIYGGVILAANAHDREDNTTTFALLRV